MLLSDRDIRAQVDAGRVVLDPWDASMVQPSSIDVRLDRSFRLFDNHKYAVIDPSQEQAELTRLVEVAADTAFVLHPGEFVLGATYEHVTLPDDLAARLEGKALALDTPVPTPRGWTTMGQLRVGDAVFDGSGRPCLVVAATPALQGRPCREVLLGDGSTFIADAAHQWVTTVKADRYRKRRGHEPVAVARTTDEIGATLRVGQEFNHQIPLAGAAQYPTAALPIDPYVLGVWLGDGTSSKAEVTDVSVYLTADADQRLALLQGLMDSDGCVDVYGRCEFVNTKEPLADAVFQLAASLGMRPSRRKKRAMLKGVDCGPAYQVTFTPRQPVFRLARKLARLKTDDNAHAHRSIRAVRAVPSVPVRCIQVSAPDGVFLVGEAYVPTHNSSLGRLGLLTHSTAGFIDPGFAGHVTLELSNTATLPIMLWPGMKIGQLCFFRLSSPADSPYGSSAAGSRYQGQRGPTASRSHVSFSRTPLG